MANHLRPLLPIIISPEQAGFVEGRQILDGVILVHEVIHSLKRTRQLRMLINLDIEKAYDKLSWQFMGRMLEVYGFCHGWVERVMSLVTTPFFNILLNGSPTHVFQPSHGIRQGDPLSPFLFILMAEGLSRLILTQAERGELRGLRIHDGMTPQTHQQFVDDTMLMGHPLVQEAQSFKNSLNLFAKALGLDVNLNKS